MSWVYRKTFTSSGADRDQVIDLLASSTIDALSKNSEQLIAKKFDEQDEIPTPDAAAERSAAAGRMCIDR
jgi:hypothetical protein